MYFIFTFEERLDLLGREIGFDQKDLKTVIESWKSARDKALRNLSYDDLNLFLRKIDRHFVDFLKKDRNIRKKCGAL